MIQEQHHLSHGCQNIPACPGIIPGAGSSSPISGDKEDVRIIIRGVNPGRKKRWSRRCCGIIISKPYMHRWRSHYMKMRIAKLYLLDKWAAENPLPLTLLTFTTYHDSAYAHRKTCGIYSIEESWHILNTVFRKASLIIRNRMMPGDSDFWIVEPQPERGYPHIHAGFFTEFTDAEIDRLKNHWSKVVKAGDKKHGLDISLKTRHKSGEMASLRNYLMKYLGKDFPCNHPGLVPGRNWSSTRLHGKRKNFASAARVTCRKR